MHMPYRIAVLTAIVCSSLFGGGKAGATEDTVVYRHLDKYGRTIFSDQKAPGAVRMDFSSWKGWTERKLKALPRQGNRHHSWKEKQKQFDPFIRNLARQHDIPHTLLHAVITAESAYDPDAVSRAGAVGLMQLMPETAKRYGVKNRTHPRENMRGGTRYLSHLLELFDRDLRLALAAYNAGENAVLRYGRKIPPYKETQHYVHKVLEYYQQYEKTMG